MLSISGMSPVVGNKKISFLNHSKIFGKTAICGVVGIERNNYHKAGLQMSYQ